jgi:nitrous oxidase accessory protein NosD
VEADSFYNELLHNNCFIDNVPQAMDEERTKTNDSTGNYWSDWSGSGSYDISGTANNTDNSPLDECPVLEEELVVRAPAVAPLGLIALVGVLSVVLGLNLRRRGKNKE